MKNLEAQITELIEKGELWRFYKSANWVRLKKSVLEEHHYECYECRKRGIITRYDTDKNGKPVQLSTVHHVFHVRTHPAFALSKTVTIAGEEHINLIPVCKSCHNRLHPEKNKNRNQKKDKFENEEWW